MYREKKNKGKEDAQEKGGCKREVSKTSVAESQR